MVYDANRLRKTYESRRRNENDQLFIERVVSTLDSEATTRPFPPDRFEDLVSSLFEAVMESMSNETGSFEESGETVLTLFMSHALFVIMYVVFFEREARECHFFMCLLCHSTHNYNSNSNTNTGTFVSIVSRTIPRTLHRNSRRYFFKSRNP